MYKSYSSKYTGKQEVFKDFSIDFPSKGFVSILGKSGCGKTTLLNVIGGIDSIDQGYVNVFGYDISKYSNVNTLIDQYRKDIVGFVFQNYNLINNISVYKNLALPLEMQGFSKEEIKIKITEVLTKVEMSEYMHRMPYELSGGQQQRIAIARAIIKDAKCILADEPTGNLDSKTAKSILLLLQEISKTRLVLFVTHEKEYADEYSDSVIELQDGEIMNEYSVELSKEETDTYKKSKLSFMTLFSRSLSHLKKGIVKSTLIILLFSVMIGIFATSIITIMTTKEEIITDTLRSSDDTVTNITSIGIVTTKDGNLAFNGSGFGFDNLIVYDAYNDLIEKYGEENVVLNSNVNIVNDIDFDGEYINSLIYPIIVNLLNKDIDYNISNLEGDLPSTSSEVIITDYIALTLFDTEDAMGEILKVNRYERYNDYVEMELTIVGIIHTDYIERGYKDTTMGLDFYYSGSTDFTPDHGYVMWERNPYAQIFAISDIFIGLDSVHQNSEELIDGIYNNGVNFYLQVDEGIKHVNGDFYSEDIVDLDSVIGRLPLSNNEIAVNIDQISWMFPTNSSDIDDLINGVISFEEFKTLLQIGNIEITYDNGTVEEQYQDFLPETFVVVGVYSKRTDEYLFPSDVSVVITKDLITALNDNYPYEHIGISILNNSRELENILLDIQERDFVNVHKLRDPRFDSTVIVNREGMFNLYRAIDEYENITIPLMYSLLYFSLAFTFILLFLYSYLSVLTNKKQLGIYRSLGFTIFDVIKMYMIEYGLISLVSIIIGFIISIFGINEIESTVFAKTMFIELNLIPFEITSTIYVIGISLGIVLLTSILPLINLLKMTPIKIINNE